MIQHQESLDQKHLEPSQKARALRNCKRKMPAPFLLADVVNHYKYKRSAGLHSFSTSRRQLCISTSLHYTKVVSERTWPHSRTDRGLRRLRLDSVRADLTELLPALCSLPAIPGYLFDPKCHRLGHRERTPFASNAAQRSFCTWPSLPREDSWTYPAHNSGPSSFAECSVNAMKRVAALRLYWRPGLMEHA